MTTDIYDELYNDGIYRYGSDEIKKFEQQLTKYFTREYSRHRDNDGHSVTIDQGPIALAPEELADNHYDEGLSFFQTFLDETTMSYTMAYYDDDVDKTLDQAQLDKFELIARRMRLKGDEHLLNFGCGFGYFESYLLNLYPGLQISALTHSKSQYDFIIERTRLSSDPLSSDRFNIFFGEINDDCIALLGENKYDVACSVGLMEQINNIDHFFNIINGLLVVDGRMFHHLIVSRDLIPQLIDPDKTMIGKYFPGGRVLPFDTLNHDLKHFTLEDSWFLNGINYWRTLEAWHENFWKNINRIYPDNMDSERIAYWNNYFVLCKAMFLPEDGDAYGNGQYLFYKKP